LGLKPKHGKIRSYLLEVGYVESVNLLAPTQARRLRVQGIVDRKTASPLSQFSGKGPA
jgi:hypothetical protein